MARGYEDVTGAVDAWGDERGLYDFGGGSGGGDVTGFTEETGHFTQLVWKETQSVGCGVFACNGQNDVGGYMLVCEYWPPGNIQGVNSKDKNVYFEENVQRQVREGDGGFDTFSATVGATGVTGTATAGAVPSSSSSESGAGRIRGVGVGWRQCGLGILVAVLACV